MAISSNSWVSMKGAKKHGFVVETIPHNAMVRWLGSKRAVPVAKKQLRMVRGPPIVHLEGALDSDTASVRSEVRFLREWANTMNVEVHAKTVWGLKELADACEMMNLKQLAPAFVIVSAHGSSTENTRKGSKRDDARIYLKPKDRAGSRLLDSQAINAFKVLKDRLVIFSSCELGKYKDDMTQFVEKTGIEAVAFTRAVY